MMLIGIWIKQFVKDKTRLLATGSQSRQLRAVGGDREKSHSKGAKIITAREEEEDREWIMA